MRVNSESVNRAKYRAGRLSAELEVKDNMKKQVVAKPDRKSSLKEQEATHRQSNEETWPAVVEAKHQVAEITQGLENDPWAEDMVILRRAAADLARRRTRTRGVSDDSFDQIIESLDNPSLEVRSAAVRALYECDPDRAASFLNLTLRQGSPAERRQVGAALAGSGLLSEAIHDLMGESHENSYRAFSLLFLVAKAGEVEPLISVIESHPSIELRLVVIRLLASSGEPEIVDAFRRLGISSSLPVEVRSAAIEASNQIVDRMSKTTTAVRVNPK
jgi:HEAT repeat protein